MPGAALHRLREAAVSAKHRLRKVVEAVDVPRYILTVLLYAAALVATFLRSRR